MNESDVSFLFVIPIENGMGSWNFPKQLRQHLYKNSVRVRGLYTKDKAYPKYLFSISNVSEHAGQGKSVITNVLGVFTFHKPDLFQINSAAVLAPMNVIPSQIRIEVVDDSFKRENKFNGWVWLELIGIKRRNVE